MNILNYSKYLYNILLTIKVNILNQQIYISLNN